MQDIYKAWVDFGIDGFRIDTVKHVNIEFWQKFAPAILGHARSGRQRRLLHVRRGVRLQPGLRRSSPRRASCQATLDFGFQAQAVAGAGQVGRRTCATSSPTTTTTPTPTPTPTSCRRSSGTTTWAVSAMMLEGARRRRRRAARARQARRTPCSSSPAASRSSTTATSRASSASGGDKAARQDMFASQDPELRHRAGAWATPPAPDRFNTQRIRSTSTSRRSPGCGPPTRRSPTARRSHRYADAAARASSRSPASTRARTSSTSSPSTTRPPRRRPRFDDLRPQPDVRAGLRHDDLRPIRQGRPTQRERSRPVGVGLEGHLTDGQAEVGPGGLPHVARSR